MNDVQPLNLAVATVVTQLLISTILVIGGFLVQSFFYRPYFSSEDRTKGMQVFGPVLLGGLSMLLLLLLTEPIAATWLPILNNPQLPTIPLSPVISIVYFVNITVAALVVGTTGGSYGSPLSPVLLTIPGLSVLVREPLEWVAAYAFLAAFAFLVTLNKPFSLEVRRQDDGPLRTAYFLVTAMCFLLTIVVAYCTRPR